MSRHACDRCSVRYRTVTEARRFVLRQTRTVETIPNDGSIGTMMFVVVAKLFDEYDGPLRTSDPQQADLFIVPYASADDCECRGRYYHCDKNINVSEIQGQLIANLKFYKDKTKRKHLFLSSNILYDAHLSFRLFSDIPLATTVGPHKCVLGENCGHKLCSPMSTPILKISQTSSVATS